MKHYKTIKGFINHLKEVSAHPVGTLPDAEKYTDEQLSALVAIKATIDNELGEYFNQ